MVVQCQRSTLEDIPRGMDFISERRQRNSPKTQVMVAQENCSTHQDAVEGQAELYMSEAIKCMT